MNKEMLDKEMQDKEMQEELYLMKTNYADNLTCSFGMFDLHAWDWS